MDQTLDSNKDGGQDLAILAPEREATIAGMPVVMREYSWAESLQHHQLVDALSDALTGVALKGDFHDLDSLRGAFGDNSHILFRLIAVASGQPVEWISGLDATAGDELFLLWWGVNADFFLRRVLRSVQLAKVREIAGLTSSPASSMPDTTQNGSGTTPTVN
jgi:hypothetical protein